MDHEHTHLLLWQPGCGFYYLFNQYLLGTQGKTIKHIITIDLYRVEILYLYSKMQKSNIASRREMKDNDKIGKQKSFSLFLDVFRELKKQERSNEKDEVVGLNNSYKA